VFLRSQTVNGRTYMGWLGEPLAETDEDQGALALRTRKDLIEEQLFDSRRDLFAELEVVWPIRRRPEPAAEAARGGRRFRISRSRIAPTAPRPSCGKRA
jgi:hypothetical protein